MTNGSSALLFTFALSAGLGLLTFAVITVTSFVKISVVLFLLRMALGVQQAPPNIVLYTVAIILTVFISAPLGREVYNSVADAQIGLNNFSDLQLLLQRASEPVRQHLLLFTLPRDRVFFLEAAQRLWPPEMRDLATSGSLIVLVPTYLIAELKRAFEIGFLIYLPFVTIDLTITTILIAMGLSQVQPNTISVPLKLLLFVLASGWTRLLHGLVLSYVR